MSGGKTIKKKPIFSKSVRYGSDEWWEKSDKKALEEYKKGNYVSFDNAEDLIKWLDL